MEMLCLYFTLLFYIKGTKGNGVIVVQPLCQQQGSHWAESMSVYKGQDNRQHCCYTSTLSFCSAGMECKITHGGRFMQARLVQCT